MASYEKENRMKDNQTGIGKNYHVQIIEIQIAGLSCKLYLPSSYDSTTEHYPVIYVNGEIAIEEVVEEVKKTGVGTEFLLLSIQPDNWNDDFTPWSAPAFRKGEGAPAGKADEYILRLTEEVKPYIDANYRTKPEPEHTVLLGYSLGGLSALYSIYRTDWFGVVGSLSGSLWYDNFCEFMEREQPIRTDLKVYLSLGKKECLSRNPRMGRVAECTEWARDILIRQLTNVCFEWNDGGHFHEIPERFAKAIAWWVKNKA